MTPDDRVCANNVSLSVYLFSVLDTPVEVNVRMCVCVCKYVLLNDFLQNYQQFMYAHHQCCCIIFSYFKPHSFISVLHICNFTFIYFFILIHLFTFFIYVSKFHFYFIFIHLKLYLFIDLI